MFSFALTHTHHVTKKLKFRKSAIRRRIFIIAELRARLWRARGAPLIRDFGKPISARKFGFAMGERSIRLAAVETNWLAHHQNFEVKSFYSDPARRNVGFFLLKSKVSLT